MPKKVGLSLFFTALLISGCTSLSPYTPVHQDPMGEGNAISRIRFVSNITGTAITLKEDNIARDLVPHTALGYYNDTRDIGMPKLSYRPQDYKGYYFEIRVKPQPMIIRIYSDKTDQGSCSAAFLVVTEAGKDYDVNLDPHEKFTKCVFHFSEIITDPTTGVVILKPLPFKMANPWNNRFE